MEGDADVSVDGTAFSVEGSSKSLFLSASFTVGTNWAGDGADSFFMLLSPSELEKRKEGKKISSTKREHHQNSQDEDEATNAE